MKIYKLKSKFTMFVLVAALIVSLPISPIIYASDLPFEEKEGFKVENIALGKSASESSGWLDDISENLRGDIIAYEYINNSSKEKNTGDLLIDGDMTTYVGFEALRDLQITHNFSGTIEGIEIFYVPKSESIGKTMKVTGSKITQTLNTFTVQGEEGKLSSSFVSVNYETNGGKMRIYSGGTYGYALDIYEIKIYASVGGFFCFEEFTDGITDVRKDFISPGSDGKMIIDLGMEYQLAGCRLFSAENLKLYLCNEYPGDELNDSDIVYTADASSGEVECVSYNKQGRYLCLVAADVSVKCAEIEVYAYLPNGGEITPESLVNLNASYPSENNFSGVTNKDGYKNIIISFNEEILTSYLNDKSVVLNDKSGESIAYEGLEVFSDKVMIPISNLKSDSEYVLTVKKGIITKSGKLLNDDFTVSFTTGKLNVLGTLNDIITSVTPSEGATGVTNIDNYGFVKIVFSANVLESSISEGVILKDGSGKNIDNIEYIFENNEYKLDLSYLTSNTKYTLTLMADKIKADSFDIKGDNFLLTFTTGNIFPYKSIEGYRITNVALNKKIYSNSVSTSSPNNVIDGNYNTYCILSNKRGGEAIIDLGNFYRVIAVQYVAANAFDYNTSTQNHYHTKDTRIYSSCGYPKNEFSNATLLHTTKAHMNGEKTLIKNTGDEYVRYISYASPFSTSVCAEIEAYAYVKEDYMPITYEITQTECVVSTSIKNYTTDDKDVYMLISAYDENGGFIGLKCKKFIAAANKNTQIEARYKLAEISDTLLSANAKKVVIQLLGGFKECRSLAAPMEIMR